MGRHSAPGTGKPEPDTGFWVRAVVVVLAVGLLVTYWLTRGEDTTRTTAQPTTTVSATTSAAPAPSPAESSAPAASPSPTPAERPPTLRFVVRRASYITVRIPGGRTLVSRVFRKGAEREFDQKRLQVVNGRPAAVDFYVNGRKRQPGPADQPETFTVRRR